MTARNDVVGIKNARGMRVLLAVVLASVMFAGLASGPSAAAAGNGGGDNRAGTAQSTELTSEVLHALRRDLGLTEEQARRQGALQAKAIKLDQELQATLGDAFAGSKYDARTGKLVVMVSDASKLDDAEARGAQARPVKHSRAKLERVKAALDAAAGKAKGTDRRHGGPRQAAAAGVVSWYVDSESNTVHVTVDKARAKQARAELAKYGDAVSIEETAVTPMAAAAYMDGGDSINYNSCSAGFNLRNRSTGVRYLLTAGHCVAAGSTTRGQGGVVFGPVLERWFPTYDDAIIRNDNPSYWVQGPWVDTNPSNGSVISVYTHTDAPVGTTVCKSGITTRWTCGRITAKNETVTYDGTSTVYGLTRHSACVEKGDSGGANVSVTDAYRAEGVSSGAQMRWDGYRWRCLSAFGQANVSWYYPIADSLAHYGPRYGVSLW